MRGKKQTKKKPTFLQGITQTVQDFFLNSACVTTDKTDTITRNNMKHQRMILTDSMINLHTDFLIRTPTVMLSYSSFKPFYVTAPKTSDRKACLCQMHENACLMLEVLRSSGVVKSNKLDDSLELVCCSTASEACLLRTCSRWLNNGTVPTQEQDKIHVQWKQWERVEEKLFRELGFERGTWNFFPTSHGKGVGGTVKRTADNLVLRGNDVTDGNTFFAKVSNSLRGKCSALLHFRRRHAKIWYTSRATSQTGSLNKTNTPGYRTWAQDPPQTTILLLQPDVPVLQPSYLVFPWLPRGTAEWYKEGKEEKTLLRKGHVDEGDGKRDGRGDGGVRGGASERSWWYYDSNDC